MVVGWAEILFEVKKERIWPNQQLSISFWEGFNSHGMECEALLWIESVMRCANKLLEELIRQFVLCICAIKFQSPTVEMLLIIAFPLSSVYCRVFEEGILRTLLEYSLRGML